MDVDPRRAFCGPFPPSVERVFFRCHETSLDPYLEAKLGDRRPRDVFINFKPLALPTVFLPADLAQLYVGHHVSRRCPI
jgi:hypothetical protein